MLFVKHFQFNPIQENTYLLYNEFNECAIIDPGCYYDHEKDELSKFIADNNLLPVLLLNTHCHLDHVFGNAFVAAEYNLIPHIHRAEEKLLEYAPTSGLMYQLPFINYQGKLNFIDEDSRVNIGREELEVLFTPGHSPGSVSFYSKANGFVISGDVLFQRSIGRTDLPGGNHEQLITSIQTKLYSLPNNTLIYSGHGGQTTIGDEKQYNPFVTASL